jgi:hypothetical protein
MEVAGDFFMPAVQALGQQRAAAGKSSSEPVARGRR